MDSQERGRGLPKEVDKRVLPGVCPRHDRRVLCDGIQRLSFPLPSSRRRRHHSLAVSCVTFKSTAFFPSSSTRRCSRQPPLSIRSRKLSIWSNEIVHHILLCSHPHGEPHPIQCRRLAVLTWEYDLRRSNEGGIDSFVCRHPFLFLFHADFMRPL